MLVLVGVMAFGHHRDDRRAVRTVQTVRALPPAPAMHEKRKMCTGQQWAPAVAARGAGAITVDTGPAAATVWWIPGMNSTSCRVQVTNLDASQADSVADAVRSTGPSTAPIACPMDDASAAWVFFRYADRSALEVIRVDLTGCEGVSAPRRQPVGPGWEVAGILHGFEPVM